MHPTYLGFQVDWPVFVKNTFSAANKNWTRGEHFNWQERRLDQYKVYTMYASGYLYHNTELEKENKVGDRLSEMNSEQLLTMVTLLNGVVKKRTSTAQEFQDKRCRQSKIDDKQRGLIRSWLRKNTWVEDDYYKFRDQVLKD
jgi:hypothetical protein